ncbi:xanthine dehydrogenase family protein molybdopterin-binding subunit [Massilia arenosa]|uniref:Xanthine dehydrogenase family protein molybdopterin-binding subunit n=1 Tax=Zemynaea arenosa TaxID=2561931 RepID=A0A4Y9S5Q4_9BURK|nr:molybdopterin cofactor-binding domain-containing protein [Massilia arenosa]TFW16521.1 xanthine dehydrogenase family protein molybdopterin-binding subunit [Massilia arenosa]
MTKATPRSRSRRRFLLGGLGVAGALVVGWGFLPPRQRLRTAAALPVTNGAVAFNGWVAIAPDGTVYVTMARSEMGQGVHTALPMLVAEELDVPLERTRITQAPIDKIFGNLVVMRESMPFHPDGRSGVRDGVQWLLGKVGRELGIMATGGSSSIRDAWQPMREAGAVARAMLVAAAAQQWKVPASECSTANGMVTHPRAGSASYGSLVAKAANIAMEVSDIKLKDPRSFRLIGREVARRDSPAKVNGSAKFGIDARPEGLVYAAVRMAPVVGDKVASFDGAPVRAMPGVLGVADFSHALSPFTGAGAGVAVIARSWWQAHQAAAALKVTWSDGGAARLSSAEIRKQLAATLQESSGFTYYSVGDVDAAAPSGARVVEAEYFAPFLAHATMEPINCTAQVRDGRVKLWVSTQVPSLAVQAAAKVAGVSSSDVSIETMLIGGGFGRRLEVDMVQQAVAIALAANGAPVQVIWSREDDIGHDVYRPVALARFRGVLDAAGRVLSWSAKSTGPSISHQYYPRAIGLPGMGPDKTTAEGEFDMQYEVPNQRIAHVIAELPVPVGNWRAVGHSQNAFFKEAFIDELAQAAGQDPVAFRRALLQGHPRHLRVLNAAIARAGEAPEGRAHGVAIHQSYGSVVAQVAEVSVADKQIRVHRVVCAIDCGLAINPNLVRQQMESSVVFGLSAALAGEITFENGRVQQTNFGDYPVLRMSEVPEVETIILPSADAPEGVGEPAVPPVAPAVAAALFKLTGQRLRSLPLRLT